MIYLDNGATTFPKLKSVTAAVAAAMNYYGANPGRSGHRLSLKASQEIYNCRVKAAKFFGVSDEERIIFTCNCTHALNIVIHGYNLLQGDHVVISNMEHNSVTRPIETLKKEKGITCSTATVYPCDNDKTVESFRASINENTKLVVCTHASNVFGYRLPIERLAALCHQYGIKILVDGAQSAGVLPIDFDKSNIDFFAAAGHKGLYGPMGTGVLILKEGETVASLMQGGTGSASDSYSQPLILPDKYESGTPNLPGIAGLARGIDFVAAKTSAAIANHEMQLLSALYTSLKNIENVKLYTPAPTLEYFAPVLSFNVKDHNSEYVAAYLNKNYDIAVRAGLHCAPLAHNAVGTADIGTVRVTPSVFTSKSQTDTFVSAINKLH